ncbi:hypothetical protein G3N58_15175 [Paraburkholderia sp. Ac-20342]|uniref:hypothetical protein n=1 Tax=Paraburkholderia sp. Ac-20342 TaxID=2703889 RepID=UPI00197DF0FA|nr:hypothetical protein [Paraburkholderia sp. Ac-20342]MBN3848162.1 hypothetical protein [Paraburkholderia sp. Ac-20342]
MRLLVRMPLPFESADGYETFECIAVRVRRPVIAPKAAAAYITVDIELPEKYREFADQKRFNADGTYLVEAVIAHNRRSLAAFLASNDNEWDVRGAS